MSHWIALLPPRAPQPAATPPDGTAAIGDAGCCPCLKAEPPGPLSTEQLAWWALQFTPRVALLEEAVVMEVQASERLFGGWRALWRRLVRDAEAWQVPAIALGHTALAALAFARHADPDHSSQTVPDAPTDMRPDSIVSTPRTVAILGRPAHLADLPLRTLSAVAVHEPTLSPLGCRTLGDVLRLPRGGLSRRFGAGLLQALDQAQGDLPLPLAWVTLPERFDARLELPGRVDTAMGLQFAARRLLLQLCAWLAAQHAGITAFTLVWWHDGRRDGERTGQHTIRLATPTRDPDRLGRLLNEHLQRLTLASPVTDLRLHANEVQRLMADNLSLIPTPGAVGPHGLSAHPDALLSTAAQRVQHDALLALLDRLSVRLGAERVRRGRIVADHRLEQAQHWQTATTDAIPTTSRPLSTHLDLTDDLPQPCWMLAQPLPLPLARAPSGLREHPTYQGPLQLLAGPHRIEAGWWDDAPGHQAVARDYYLASSARAGLLWIYKTRPVVQADGAPAKDGAQTWFLHGLFA